MPRPESGRSGLDFLDYLDILDYLEHQDFSRPSGFSRPDPRRITAEVYIQEAVPKVVTIAVSTVIRMLRILPQRVLLLKVPIVLKG